MKVLALLVALLVIGGVGFYLVNGMHSSSPAGTTSVTTKGAQGEVTVTQTDITKNGLSRLPVGFPKDIPVEVPNITDSYRVAYTNRGVTQYSVSYTSSKAKDALWDIYNNFMKSSGFDIDKGSSKSLGQIIGLRSGDTLSVVISSHSGVSLVQLGLLDRQ